jgi:hypothetical protein
MTLEVRTKSYRGRIEKTAQVFTNDPETPETVLSIRGNLWVPIYMSTERVRLKGKVGENIRNSIQVRGQKEIPLKLKEVSVNVPDKVDVKIHKQAEEQNYLVAFRNKLDTEGHYIGYATITTNYPDQPKIQIQILGAITANVQAKPKVLSFPFMTKKRLDKLRDSDDSIAAQAVTVFVEEGADLKIEQVSLERSLYTFSINETKPGKRYEIRVKPVLRHLDVGMNQDLLKIHTNQEHHELFEIPIRLNLGR